MIAEQIKEKLRRSFRPFVLHGSDGRQFKVLHSEFILVARGIVVLVREEDLVETVDTLHITRVEDITAEAA